MPRCRDPRWPIIVRHHHGSKSCCDVVITFLNSLTSEVSAGGATVRSRRGRGFQAPRKTSKLGAQARDDPSHMEELTAEARAP